MYKLLLCWRYLKTRYLAFACIISVMLGVATLIVVNSVMNGFSTKLRTLLHSVMSDVTIAGQSMNGFPDPLGKIERIRKDPYLHSKIEAMAVTVDAFAMLQYRHPGGQNEMRPVRVMGIDMASRIQVGGFQENLEKQKKSLAPTFDIPNDIRAMVERWEDNNRQERELAHQFPMPPVHNVQAMLPPELKGLIGDPKDPKDLPPPPMPVPHRMHMPQGVILGHLLAHYKFRDPDTGKIKEAAAIIPGDMVVLTTVKGQELKPSQDSFIVVDYFQSKMSTYDENSVFVPLEHLQTMCGMENRATSILIKLKDYNEAEDVVKALAKVFAHEPLQIQTWEEKQGPLLKAIEVEKGLLNVLLFMIIAVAGFGILAIFSMIVAEKKRDIGVLKALGAPSYGVMQIFLTYGLSLGVVGSLLGTLLGLSITYNINGIEALIGSLTGSKLFPGDIYYFNEIPTDVRPFAILLVNLGAIAIATVFSILPALRAAMLHPVQALRYE